MFFRSELYAGWQMVEVQDFREGRLSRLSGYDTPGVRSLATGVLLKPFYTDLRIYCHAVCAYQVVHGLVLAGYLQDDLI